MLQAPSEWRLTGRVGRSLRGRSGGRGRWVLVARRAWRAVGAARTRGPAGAGGGAGGGGGQGRRGVVAAVDRQQPGRPPAGRAGNAGPRAPQPAENSPPPDGVLR